LRNHRRVQKWHNKQYKKKHFGTAWKANPFGGASHAKGIVLEKMYVLSPPLTTLLYSSQHTAIHFFYCPIVTNSKTALSNSNAVQCFSQLAFYQQIISIATLISLSLSLSLSFTLCCLFVLE
jgi:hypothetical protein